MQNTVICAPHQCRHLIYVNPRSTQIKPFCDLHVHQEISGCILYEVLQCVSGLTALLSTSLFSNSDSADAVMNYAMMLIWLLSFSRRYSYISTCGSERECAGVSGSERE